MLTRLNGIRFVDLPYISKWENVIVVREEGELWDSDARPSYSVRWDGLHIGYIPLVETVKEEALKARDGYKKKWREGFEDYTPAQLRAISTNLNETGELIEFHEWEFIGKEETKGLAKRKMDECAVIEIIRDWLYVEIMRNHFTPTGKASPMYYDEQIGVNFHEIGDICSISVFFNVDGGGYDDPLATQTSVANEAYRASLADQS